MGNATWWDKTRRWIPLTPWWRERREMQRAKAARRARRGAKR